MAASRAVSAHALPVLELFQAHLVPELELKTPQQQLKGEPKEGRVMATLRYSSAVAYTLGTRYSRRQHMSVC